MDEKEKLNWINKFDKKAKCASRKCLYNNCTNRAIDSHLLQKCGILNQISENEHLMELTFDNFKKELFYFRSIGVNKALTFPGFCSIHDNELFKSIESDQIDFFQYRTQLLFSYRAVMNELRKKEILIDAFNRRLKSNILSPHLSSKYVEEIRENIIGQEHGINDELFYNKIFLENIQDSNKRDFKFITIEIPKVEFCISSVFTYETSAELLIMSLVPGYDSKIPLNEIYFHLIPQNEKCFIIIGCLDSSSNLCWDFIKSFDDNDVNICLKKISDLVLCQVENWLCSNSFYKKSLKKRESEIIKIIHEYNVTLNERRELNINLFE